MKLKKLIVCIGPLELTETKERVVANLANFAYDPYNYAFLRQVLNVYFWYCMLCFSAALEMFVFFSPFLKLFH